MKGLKHHMTKSVIYGCCQEIFEVEFIGDGAPRTWSRVEMCIQYVLNDIRIPATKICNLPCFAMAKVNECCF